MTEQELNKTPLSQECKKLLKNPSPNSLYLLQALQLAQEQNQPDWTRSTNRRAQAYWRATKETLEALMYRTKPDVAYRVLTTSGELGEEMSDAALLAEMQKETEREDKLQTLLDWATDNLEGNGFNLSGSELTRD